MRQYELMVILPPTVELTDKTAQDMVEKLIGTEATVSSVTLLGKKPLAYTIKKQNEGVYVLATLEGEHIRVNEIEKKVQLGAEVLRYLLIAKK